MSIDDLSRTLDTSEGEFKILLEIIVSNIAETKALSLLVIDLLAQGDPSIKADHLKTMETILTNQRGKVIAGLYERFGYLPPNISEK